MSEKKILNDIMVAHSAKGGRLFRNNTGKGWTGRSTRIERSGHHHLERGDVVIKNARRLHYGLCKGSHDLIGWTPVKISKEMIGQTLAVFTSVEAKTGKLKPTKEQVNFGFQVKEAGGLQAVVYSVDEYKEKI